MSFEIRVWTDTTACAVAMLPNRTGFFQVAGSGDGPRTPEELVAYLAWLWAKDVEKEEGRGALAPAPPASPAPGRPRVRTL